MTETVPLPSVDQVEPLEIFVLADVHVAVVGQVAPQPAGYRVNTAFTVTLL